MILSVYGNILLRTIIYLYIIIEYVCRSDQMNLLLELITMQYCIGGHANVFFSDSKETGPSTILKTVLSNCRHLIETLITFGQNHSHLLLNAPTCDTRQNLHKSPCIHVPTWPIAETILINPSAW